MTLSARKNLSYTLVFCLACSGILLLNSQSADGAETGSWQASKVPDWRDSVTAHFEIPVDWDAHGKSLRWEYWRFDQTTDSYYFLYSNPTAEHFCFEATIDVTEGNTDLYMTYEEPWSSDVVPPSQGTEICSSTLPGLSQEYCNGCDLEWCVWGESGVWRIYGYTVEGPSDYCITIEMYPCQFDPEIFVDGFETGSTSAWDN